MELITIIDRESNGPHASSHHGILVVVELNSLVIKRKSLEFVIEEEVHCFLIQLQSETFQEGDIVIDEFIVVQGQIKMRAPNQFIQKSMRKNVN
jgi:RNase P/RNase MRP subunit p29